MTSHENDHTAGPEGCQANAVRWKITPSDLNLVSSRQYLREQCLPHVQEPAQFPALVAASSLTGLSCLRWGYAEGQWQKQLAKTPSYCRQGWWNSLLHCLHRLYRRLSVLIWSSVQILESPSSKVNKKRMDDGGRRGNAPPDAVGKKVLQKQSGIAK